MKRDRDSLKRITYSKFFEFIEETSGSNHSRQDGILRLVVQLTDAHSGPSCTLSRRVFGTIARTDHCPKLSKTSGYI